MVCLALDFNTYTNFQKGEHTMMDFNDVMKKHTVTETYNFLQEFSISIEYFLGGSTRFGFDIPSSDIDFFVYIPKGFFSDFEDYLMKNGFIKDRNSNEFYNAEELYYHPQYKIHMAIMMNRTKFDYLKSDHDDVSSYLEDTPSLVKFIKCFKLNLKCNKKEDKGMGKYIFQSLCSTVGIE